MDCIIDVGGGNRGVYGAGIFDRLIDDKIMFDICIGVSAGSANIVTYIAGQRGRLYSFYHDYAFRKEYMSLKNLLATGEYINLEYIYGTLTNSGGENPLDLDRIRQFPGLTQIVVTDAVSGRAEYLDASSLIKDDFYALKASCAIPFVCRPVKRDGKTYFDGGISDPVPYKRALELGADRIVLILTQPLDYIKKRGADALAARLLQKEYPETAKKLYDRAQTCNTAVAEALRLQSEGRLLILAPENCDGVGTLKKSPRSIDALYKRGYADAGAVKDFLK